MHISKKYKRGPFGLAEGRILKGGQFLEGEAPLPAKTAHDAIKPAPIFVCDNNQKLLENRTKMTQNLSVLHFIGSLHCCQIELAIKTRTFLIL